MNHCLENEHFRVASHPAHSRLRQIVLNEHVITNFLESVQCVDTQELEYVPYMRFILADKLLALAGRRFAETLSKILHDRECGGFTISVREQTTSADDYVKFATAITHLFGLPNFDAMSGTYYARFTVKNTDNSDSYLRQAYRLFTLHTDGTFVDENTDWLLMMKMQEQQAIGGESRLLHLDDWEDLSRFLEHPLASVKITYKAPPSKNIQQIVHRPTFFLQNNKPCICFIDQFAHPETIEQATFLQDLSRSMEKSRALIELSLPVGDLVVLNNTFWLHGRAAFQKHPELHRELMRLRGVFSNAL